MVVQSVDDSSEDQVVRGWVAWLALVAMIGLVGSVGLTAWIDEHTLVTEKAPAHYHQCFQDQVETELIPWGAIPWEEAYMTVMVPQMEGTQMTEALPDQTEVSVVLKNRLRMVYTDTEMAAEEAGCTVD